MSNEPKVQPTVTIYKTYPEAHTLHTVTHTSIVYYSVQVCNNLDNTQHTPTHPHTE